MTTRNLTPWRIQNHDAVLTPELLYSSESKEAHVRDYVHILLKRRLWVVLALLAALGYGVYINWTTIPLYTATTTVKIEPQLQLSTGSGDSVNAQSGSGYDYDYYQTQFVLLERSRPLAARLIAELGLASDQTFLGPKSEPGILHRVRLWLWNLVRGVFTTLSNVWSAVSSLFGQPPSVPEGVLQAKEPSSPENFIFGVNPGLISRYLGFLKINPVRTTRLVQVQFTTHDPRLSQSLANAHATAFIHMNMETRFALTKEAREFLEKKLGEVKVKVERSESALQNFRQAYGVVSVEGSENIVIARLVDLNKRLTEAQARRIELESLYRMVADKNSSYLSQVVDNNLIQQFKSALNALEAEKAQLSTIFKPDHPRLIQLGDQIREARRRLDREIANIFRGVESDYAAARAREEALQNDVDRQQKEALSLKGLGIQYTVLQQDVDSSRTLYKNLLEQLNETNVSSAAAVSNIEIVELADTPRGPSYPNTQRNLLIAACLGLFFGVGVAFAVEYFDSTVHTPEDVWRSVALPTLGVVPHFKALRDRSYGYHSLPTNSPVSQLSQSKVARPLSLQPELVVSQHPLSIVSEAYRTIRTALLLAQTGELPQLMLVTSAHPAAGKTVTTLNLAIALAQGGHTVVVVDADMRKGCCHALLHMRNSRGLSNILMNTLSLDEGLQQTPIAGLSLLSRGVLTPNPIDLLGSPKLKDLLDNLRQRFDFILMDSPPAVTVSDAVMLATLSDGVLLVLRGQKTTIDSARRLVEHLSLARAKILGVVLNGVDLRNPSYSDYRRYYASSYAAAEEGEI